MLTDIASSIWLLYEINMEELMMKSNAMANKGKRYLVKGLLAAAVLVFAVGCNNAADDRAGAATTHELGDGITFVEHDMEHNPVVATANGREIHAGDIEILIPQAQEAMMWEFFSMHEHLDIDPDSEFRDGKTFGRAVLEEAVRLAAFTQVYLADAERLAVTLTEDDIAMVQGHINSLFEEHGELELHMMIWENGFRSIEHLQDILHSQLIWNNLVHELLETPEEFERFENYMRDDADMLENLLGAKHILANFAEFDTEEEAEAFANGILERIGAGEDFDELMWAYGQDPGMASFPNGYSFGSGDMVPEFEDATRELEFGEVSGLVRSGFGFHIIKRTEPNLDDWHMMQGLPPMTLENRMIEAIFHGYEAMSHAAELVFFPELDDVSIR